MAAETPHLIVFANEKGGSGKSTTAVHTAVALAAAGRSVATLDLDERQRTTTRYLENRVASAKRRNIDLAMPSFEVVRGDTVDALQGQIDELGTDVDFLVIDTPGRDDALARAAIAQADTLVTPINDSFVDLDLIGQVDAETYAVRRPSFYAELIWDARKQRARVDGGTVGWVVLRNRLQHVEARNRPFRTRHLSRAVPQGADAARYRASRRCRHGPCRRAAGVARDGLGPGASRASVGGRRLIKVLILAALAYFGWRWLTANPSRTSIEEARSLLELPEGADREQIRTAHRRLIARVHPDAGGSAELTRRVNEARDILLKTISKN